MENAGPSGVKPRSWTRRSGSGLSCNGAYSRRSASALSDARSSAVAAKTTALQGAQHAKYTMSPGRATGQEDAHALNARPATPTQLTPVIASLVRCRDRPLGRTNSRTRGCDGKATVTALSNNAETTQTSTTESAVYRGPLLKKKTRYDVPAASHEPFQSCEALGCKASYKDVSYEYTIWAICTGRRRFETGNRTTIEQRLTSYTLQHTIHQKSTTA
jgi:hypothetical protein